MGQCKSNLTDNEYDDYRNNLQQNREDSNRMLTHNVDANSNFKFNQMSVHQLQNNNEIQDNQIQKIKQQTNGNNDFASITLQQSPTKQQQINEQNLNASNLPLKADNKNDQSQLKSYQSTGALSPSQTQGNLNKYQKESTYKDEISEQLTNQSLVQSKQKLGSPNSAQKNNNNTQPSTIPIISTVSESNNDSQELISHHKQSKYELTENTQINADKYESKQNYSSIDFSSLNLQNQPQLQQPLQWSQLQKIDSSIKTPIINNSFFQSQNDNLYNEQVMQQPVFQEVQVNNIDTQNCDGLRFTLAPTFSQYQIAPQPYSFQGEYLPAQQELTRFGNQGEEQQNQQGQNNKNTQLQNIEQLSSQRPSVQQIIQQQQTLIKERVREQYEDNSVYEGEKLGGYRHGEGKFYYSNGAIYQGFWRDGHINGYGILFYPNGQKAYEGEWIDDKFNGYGVVYNEIQSKQNSTILIQNEYRSSQNNAELQQQEQFVFNGENFDELGESWEKYEGYFKNDFKEGLGTLFLQNGDKFVGKFKFDYVHGKGAYYKQNGEIIFGEWAINKLVQTYQ